MLESADGFGVAVKFSGDEMQNRNMPSLATTQIWK